MVVVQSLWAFVVSSQKRLVFMALGVFFLAMLTYFILQAFFNDQTAPFFSSSVTVSAAVPSATARTLARNSVQLQAVEHAAQKVLQKSTLPLFFDAPTDAQALVVAAGLPHVSIDTTADNTVFARLAEPWVLAEERILLYNALRSSSWFQENRALWVQKALTLRQALLLAQGFANPKRSTRIWPQTIQRDTASKQLQTLTQRLDMLDAYFHLLNQVPRAPESFLKQIGAFLHNDPDNLLLAVAYAEALLDNDKPTEALAVLSSMNIDEHASEVAQIPGLTARFYGARGRAYVPLKMFTLAEHDLSRALVSDPKQPTLWRARAAARILHNKSGACSDLNKACVFGDCADLFMAVQQGLCR